MTRVESKIKLQVADNKEFTPPTRHANNESQRLSNIELLRIVAMFLVLMVHVNFFSIGTPSCEETAINPLSSFARFFFQSTSIICVNVFVLISGWFGIRPNIKNMGEFLFQCFFFLFGIYTILLLAGKANLTANGIAGCFMLLKWNWFIKAYICLCIFAPALNEFVKHSEEKQLRATLICFYIFQTLYGWLFNAAIFIESGYSTISFMGLYLLAQYLRRYSNVLTTKSYKFDLAIFAACLLINTIGAFGLSCMNFDIDYNRIFAYISPCVIVCSVYFLLAFSKLNIKSKIINWIAASSFAVFLLHTHPSIIETYFKKTSKVIFENYSGFSYILTITTFLLVIYVTAILIDQIRIRFWNGLLKLTNPQLH